MVEFFPDDQVLNFRRLVDRQLEFKDGMLTLPTLPGLGFDFDEEAVARYSLAGRPTPWKQITKQA
jgi:L-alanine-DL-glutamate epimerase-like enolase superfamily enzyme